MNKGQESTEKLNRESSGKWRTLLGAFIPQYIPNRIVCGAMGVLSILHRTSKGKREANRAYNLEIFKKHWKSLAQEAEEGSACIENQPQWSEVRYGNKSTMAFSGCEILAVYNALLALGVKLSEQELAELISGFEKKGAVWAGWFGTTPGAICRYFRKHGYHVERLYCREEGVLNKLGEDCDTIVAMVYNDARDIFKMIHTVNISKDSTGKFHAHNCYKMGAGNHYVSDGPFSTLWDAIHEMGRGKSALVCVMGISKNSCTERIKEV